MRQSPGPRRRSQPRAALEILDTQRAALNGLLKGIPADLDLDLAGPEVVGPDSAASHAWHQLFEIKGVGWVTAGKLLARKRPRLIPVYDQLV